MCNGPGSASREVECPECGEQVTIHFEDRECSECGINISERKREERNRLRSVKDDVAQVIRDSEVKLRDSRLQDNVARLDVQMDGPLTYDASEVNDVELENRVNRQNHLHELISEVKESEEVLDVEVWYAEESDTASGQTGSKYGMKPDLSLAGEGEVTLLVGLASDVY